MTTHLHPPWESTLPGDPGVHQRPGSGGGGTRRDLLGATKNCKRNVTEKVTEGEIKDKLHSGQERGRVPGRPDGHILKLWLLDSRSDSNHPAEFRLV